MSNACHVSMSLFLTRRIPDAVKQTGRAGSPLWFEQEENLMADHLDAPGLVSPDSNPKTDITDIYIFQKPGNASKSILILNVNPLAPTLANEFESNGLYELNIDTDGDALEIGRAHV